MMLTLRHVRFVFDVEDHSAVSSDDGDPTSAVRILAMFSVPTTESPLDVRRERRMLEELIGEVSRAGRRVDVRVLQYGATCEALKHALAEPEGWDIVHFAGHSAPGSVALERTDGSWDDISAVYLASLLRHFRVRPKLVTLLACQSAAAVIDEALHWIEGTVQTDDRAIHTAFETKCETIESMSVARVLVREIGCAVLGMRYEVEDDFAIDLSHEFYRALLKEGRSIPSSLAHALARIIASSLRTDPLSIAAPALFARSTAALFVHNTRTGSCPTETVTANRDTLPSAGERFVGRVQLLSSASAALREESCNSGVLFFGMPGSGKTQCALELAHHLAADYSGAPIWYSVPDDCDAVSSSFTQFKSLLEAAYPDILVSGGIDAFRRHRVLAIIDDVDRLLRPDGGWLDDRWKALLAVLLAPGSAARTILTSRYRPTEFRDSVVPLPVTAISYRESALLALRLPNLKQLWYEVREGGPCDARELLSGTLELLHGHPALLELADTLAIDRVALAARLRRAALAADNERLAAFFGGGPILYDSSDVVQALRNWTWKVVAGLSDDAQRLFVVLCLLNEADRGSSVAFTLWEHVWKALYAEGSAPDADRVVKELVAASLAARGSDSMIVIHRAIAEAGSVRAADVVHAAVDREATSFWISRFARALEAKPVLTDAIANAGLAAVPYLRRLGDWSTAISILERVCAADPTPRTGVEVLRFLATVPEAPTGTRDGLTLAKLKADALTISGSVQEAERLVREARAVALECADWGAVEVLSSSLIMLLSRASRFDEARAIRDEVLRLPEAAGCGPWGTLLDEATRLELDLQLGDRDSAVLDAAERAITETEALADATARGERVDPVTVREKLINVARSAALRTRQFERALVHGYRLLDALKARGATDLQVATARYNHSLLLSEAGKHDEAAELLQSAREVAEEAGDLDLVGKALSAQAVDAKNANHFKRAVAFEKSALQYKYDSGNVEGIVIGHSNLGKYLRLTGAPIRYVLAHYLAAALIGQLSQNRRDWAMRRFVSSIEDSAELPEGFARLCSALQMDLDVPFEEFVRDYAGDGADLDEVLDIIIKAALEPDHF
jgi:tetratricopeptide (TPR) repeat protein